MNTETYPGVEIVAGAMAGWSDHTALHPPAGPGYEAAVKAVLDAPPPAHVLITGPHSWSVVEAAAASATRTTLVLRGESDAVEAGRRLAPLGDGVRVICGDLAAAADFLAHERHDAVLALDGVERLHSVDVAARPWRETWDLVAGLTEPGSRMAAVVPHGADLRLLAPPMPEAVDDDDAWQAFDTFDTSRPGGPADLERLVPGSTVLSLWPTTAAPTLLADEETDPRLILSHVPTGTVRSFDLQVAAARAAAAGHLDSLAPGWLVLRGPALPRESPAGQTTALWELDTLIACSRRDTAAVRAQVHILQGLTDDIVPHLARLAARLTSLGWRHPWPAARDAQDIVVLMAAMGGLTLSRAQSAPSISGAASAVSDAEARLADANEALLGQVSWLRKQLRQRETLIARMSQHQPPAQGSRARVRALELELSTIRRTWWYRAASRLPRRGA